jgi:hypothetical protein
MSLPSHAHSCKKWLAGTQPFRLEQSDNINSMLPVAAQQFLNDRGEMAEWLKAMVC